MVTRTWMILATALLLPACKVQKPAPAQDTPAKRGGVELAFHVMSQCPFGGMVENAVKPALDQLGPAVDFRLHFIGEEPSPGRLTSMHGDKEVQGDLLQICAMKLAPDRFMDLVLCMNKDMKAIPGNFDACAVDSKVDGPKVKACANGKEGRGLLSDSFKASARKGARGSPTIYLAGEAYEGGRETADFLRAVCSRIKSDKPEACRNIPDPKKVDLTILTDGRCADCKPDRILPRFKAAFPGLTAPRTVDYATLEGKALYATIRAKGVTVLPAFLLSPSAAEEPNWTQFQSSATDIGTHRVVTMGAKFDPTAEICDNGQDDDGNGQIDCQDPGCGGKKVCRREVKNRLEVFVMSQCPFGIKALNAMREVLAAFERKIDFRIHFIADSAGPAEFKSMHGQGEVDEDIREICVMKHYGEGMKYMDYFWCRGEDIKSADWQKCAKDGIDPKVVEACATGPEGRELFAADLKVAKDLDIGASPTWLANNRFQFSGVAPEKIKQMFCAYNAGTRGCEKTLTNDVKGPSGGCGSN